MSNKSEQSLNIIQQLLDDINEDDAFVIFDALKNKFYWAGTVFCRDDIREQIARGRDVEFDRFAERDPDVEKIVDYVIGTANWRVGLEDCMTEYGYEKCLIDTVWQAEAGDETTEEK